LMQVNASGVVVNEQGYDRDFRVESDNNANTFFVNAGTGKIGIGEQGTSGNWTNGSWTGFGFNGGSTVGVFSNTSYPAINLTENGYPNDGSFVSGYVRSNTGKSTNIQLDRGDINFRSAGSDSAGSAITWYSMLELKDDSLGAIFNEDGRDRDFRVESDTATHALFVNAGNNRVGINTSDPNATLSVNGNFRFEGTSPVPILSGFHDGIDCLKLDSNSGVGSGSLLFGIFNNGAQKVRIEGNGDLQNVNNAYGAISDERLKENIADASSQWDDIKAVRVRKFSLIEDGLDSANMIGVIAQELEASGMGNLVKTTNNPDTEEEYKAVKYSILYMKAIKALQEAITKIETLEAKVTALENA